MVSTVQIFCRVIDNYGDAGVCLRLARRFAAEGLCATLFCDRLEVLRSLAPAPLRGVTFAPWPEDEPPAPADLVFETFGCRLPDAFERRLPGSGAHVYNLDYLSAEDWVEDCHDVEGLHPTLPIKKRWFFPGFTDRTGGLLIEPDYEEERLAFDAAARHAFLRSAGMNDAQCARPLFYAFGYPDDDAETLLAALRLTGEPWVVLAAPGGLSEKLERLLAGSPIDFVRAPFVAQTDFDRFLWSADAALVRGEDSFVRAQWAGTPFFWSIYRTQDRAHEIKFDAWRARVEALCGNAALTRALGANGDWLRGVGTSETVARFLSDRQTLRAAFAPWRESLFARGDLVVRLLARHRD